MPLTARPAEAAALLLARGTVAAYGSVSDWSDRAPRLRGTDATRLRGSTHPDVRARFLAARALLHHITGTAELTYTSTGRPCLREYAVSLSHTGDLVLVGLCTRTRLTIGVDVERADRRLDGPRFPSRMCTPGELTRLARTPPDARNALLLRWWTSKEAYSKALGHGLGLDFTTFDAHPPPTWTLHTQTLTTETPYTTAVAIGPASPKDTP
ncbi:4'-phosphopantetheinyl transferase superfamily protein [Streptomyces sp. NPDC051954]|uniref:4'-phosphopantetheinyl transferase family protein n=1 Tax=unclassified Streptomyces TaxID=2593676 RepID=UPI003429875C